MTQLDIDANSACLLSLLSLPVQVGGLQQFTKQTCKE